MDTDIISCRGRAFHVCVCAAEIHQDCRECVHSVEIKSLTGHLHNTHIHHWNGCQCVGVYALLDEARDTPA